MPSLEERVALLEGRVQEHGAFMTDLRASNGELRESIRDLRAEMERRFDAIERRFDGRFEGIDRRFERIDGRFDRMERHFAWLVGIVITGFVTVIGTVASAFWAVVQRVP
jgi:hypothetical protein